MSSSVNLYEVLNLEKTATKKEIKKAYRRMVKEFHPDHGGDPQLFELVTHAYNVLYNEESRATYDNAYSISKRAEGNFQDMKDEAQAFLEAQENEAKLHSKEEVENEFKLANSELNAKHGYQTSSELNKEIDQDEFNNRMTDLEILREQEEIEYEQEQLFDDQAMNGDNFNAMFNAAWDKKYGGGTSLVAHDGNPDAFDGSGFGSFETHEENNLYREDENDSAFNGENFGSLNMGQTGRRLTRKEVSELQGAEYTNNHTKDASTDEYKAMLEQRMKERELETQELDDFEMDDFVDDETFGGYGLSHQLGFTGSDITWDNSDHIREKHRLLLKYREEKQKKLEEQKTGTNQDDDLDEDERRQLRREERRRKRRERRNKTD